MSAWATTTRAPACSISFSLPSAAGVAPRRPSNTRCRAPRDAIQRATSRPKPPKPPLMRYVPSLRRVTGSRIVEVSALMHQPRDVSDVGAEGYLIFSSS